MLVGTMGWLIWAVDVYPRELADSFQLGYAQCTGIHSLTLSVNLDQAFQFMLAVGSLMSFQ